jgi:hypothetical protein
MASFVCKLNDQTSYALGVLSKLYGLNQSDMVRELVIAAVQEEPAVREAVVMDFKAKLKRHQALRGESPEMELRDA